MFKIYFKFKQKIKKSERSVTDQRLTYRRHTQITLLSKLFHRKKMDMFNRPAIGTRFLNHNKTIVQELSAFEKNIILLLPLSL